MNLTNRLLFSFIFVLSVINILNCKRTELPKKDIRIHGHRGARSYYPGNTMPSFRYAIEAGADVLELDLVVSKDKQLVVSHDNYLMKEFCLGVGGVQLKEDIPIYQLNYEEIKKYDCGKLTSKRFPRQLSAPGEYPPLLSDVISLAIKSGKKLELNIETKISPFIEKQTVSHREFAELLAKELRKHGFISRSMIQSFDYRTLAVIKQILPEIRIVLLFEGNTVDYLHEAKSFKAFAISPNYQWITKEIVIQMQKAGILVIPWTINSKEDIEYSLSMGVDGIITDDPVLGVELKNTFLNTHK